MSVILSRTQCVKVYQEWQTTTSVIWDSNGNNGVSNKYTWYIQLNSIQVPILKMQISGRAWVLNAVKKDSSYTNGGDVGLQISYDVIM